MIHINPEIDLYGQAWQRYGLPDVTSQGLVLIRPDGYVMGRWRDLDPAAFAGLFLPGGHAPGMRPYLESERVQAIAAAAFQANKPVSAICHGVIPLVRAKGPDGRALLYGRRTTALTGGMENFAVSITRQALGNHYRTYPQSVEDEVRVNLAKKSDFKTGPLFLARRCMDACDGFLPDGLICKSLSASFGTHPVAQCANEAPHPLWRPT